MKSTSRSSTDTSRRLHQIEYFRKKVHLHRTIFDRICANKTIFGIVSLSQDRTIFGQNNTVFGQNNIWTDNIWTEQQYLGSKQYLGSYPLYTSK